MKIKMLFATLRGLKVFIIRFTDRRSSSAGPRSSGSGNARELP
jgi:hypothetical protein